MGMDYRTYAALNPPPPLPRTSQMPHPMLTKMCGLCNRWVRADKLHVYVQKRGKMRRTALLCGGCDAKVRSQNGQR